MLVSLLTLLAEPGLKTDPNWAELPLLGFGNG